MAARACRSSSVETPAAMARRGRTAWASSLSRAALMDWDVERIFTGGMDYLHITATPWICMSLLLAVTSFQSMSIPAGSLDRLAKPVSTETPTS
mgnify:CR=1 FL=1